MRFQYVCHQTVMKCGINSYRCLIPMPKSLFAEFKEQLNVL